MYIQQQVQDQNVTYMYFCDLFLYDLEHKLPKIKITLLYKTINVAPSTNHKHMFFGLTFFFF